MKSSKRSVKGNENKEKEKTRDFSNTKFGYPIELLPEHYEAVTQRDSLACVGPPCHYNVHTCANVS